MPDLTPAPDAEQMARLRDAADNDPASLAWALGAPGARRSELHVALNHMGADEVDRCALRLERAGS